MAQAVPIILAAGRIITSAVRVIGRTLVAQTGRILLAAGLQIASSRLRPKPKLPTPEDGKAPLRQPSAPRYSGYGRCRIAGVYACYEERNGVSVDVIALHDGRIDAIESYYLHDDPVTVAGSTVQARPDGAYGGNAITIEARLGLATETAYASAINALGSNVWTAGHRGDGIASICLISRGVAQQDFNKIYPNGLPQPSAVIRASLVYDPRDGAQSRSDPSTWKWSDNPALCLAHFLCDASAGFNHDWARRIAPAINDWIAAADVCDAPVPLAAGGTEKRYRIGGFYQHSNDPVEVVDMILAACDGWLAVRGDGAFVFRAGKFETPSVTINDDHVLEYTVQRFVEDEDAVNELTVAYTEPAKDFNEAEAAAWIDAADKAERGKDRVQNVQAQWVPSRTQARRLAKREVLRSNSQARGRLRTNLFGLAALGARYVRIQLASVASLQDVTVEIQSIEIELSSLTIVMEWTRIDASIDDWNPATEEGPAPASGGGNPVTTLPTPSGPLGQSVFLRDDRANAWTSAFWVTFDDPGRNDVSARVRLQFLAGLGFQAVDHFFSRSEMIDAGGGKLRVQVIMTRGGPIFGATVAFRMPGGTIGAETIIAGAPWSLAMADSFPPPPKSISVTGNAGTADIAWTTYHDAAINRTRLYRNTTSSFAAATMIHERTASAGTAQTFNTGALASGAHFFWLTHVTTTANRESLDVAGPFQITV